MKVQEIMSRTLYCCAPGDTLAKAAQIMWDNDCGFLPVVDEASEVVGVITDRDICMAAYTRGRTLNDEVVASTMTGNVVTCRVDDRLSDVEELMKSARIRRLPVLDEFGNLVGVVTIGDLARCSTSRSVIGAAFVPGVAQTLAAICQNERQSMAAE